MLLVDGGKLSKIKPSEAKANILLKFFIALEQEFGRPEIRDKKWGPRTLDIDFLVWGDLKVNNQSLILPHPRIFERSFVLIPLAEIFKNEQPFLEQMPLTEDWT